jgi:hypothetical protein
VHIIIRLIRKKWQQCCSYTTKPLASIIPSALSHSKKLYAIIISFSCQSHQQIRCKHHPVLPDILIVVSSIMQSNFSHVNRSGKMVSMLPWRVVDHGLEPWSCQTKGQIMVSNLGHVKPWSCLTLVMSNLGHVKPWSCLTLVMSNLGHVKPWSCQTLIMSNLGHVKPRSCQTLVMSNLGHVKP